ncbi:MULTISPECIES: tol-pal system YbgF family protein [Flavobacterium]|uniref:Tetratricopeptide repeat protein n=1 Tax=Flavobacterium endoglycinae TaxID=2816357 RepID=A0ABX7QJ69_9FLAO|nr:MULTISPECIES: CDC27 family protein [Flavobacterium]QSW91062.1 tetratricopeptide repeat protein [Flavobacterium endoglycinae]
MNEERYILFDEYLQDELTPGAKTDFENQLTQDPEFASQFETFKNVHTQLNTKFGIEQERQAFKENLTQISKQHFDKDTKVIGLKPWYLAVAASVAVLFGLFFFNYNQNPSFADYNNPEHASFTERSTADETLKQAETAYNKKRYNTAIPLFETILQKQKTAEIQFFYGVSLLEESHYKKAEDVFNALKNGTSVYKEKALWYLALSKLKQKDYEECKKILESISEDYEDYDQVEELLHQLD